MEKLLSRMEVCDLIGLSYPSIWDKMRKGTFPRSVSLGPGRRGRVAWRESEIEKWIKELPIAPLKGDKVKRRRKR